MQAMDSNLRSLVPAISSILARHPEEPDAAPDLRRLAIKHHQRRYRVFAAYRLLKQDRDETSERLDDVPLAS